MSEHSKHTKHRVDGVLNAIGLPNLRRMIASGTLHETIDHAYETLDRLNAMLDAWEEAEPHAAALAPWKAGRDEWKAQGRPAPEWYEVLQWIALTPLTATVLKNEVVMNKRWEYNARRCARLGWKPALNRRGPRM